MEVKVLSKADIMQVVDMGRMIIGVEEVYRLKSRGETEVWPTVFYEFTPGESDMDIKSGLLKGSKIFGHKTVTWFGTNKELGIPELIGVIMVYDANTGTPLGILDATYITGIRTGAAGAIGAKYLARKDSKNLLILGTGNQATFQIVAMLTCFKGLEKIRVANSLHPDKAKDFVLDIEERLEKKFGLSCKNISFEAVGNLGEAVSDSDIVITVTPARKPVIKKAWIRPGTHFSCIGADMSGKVELEPDILRNAKIYVDDKKHCMTVGEIEISLKTGIINEKNIVGEIGNLLEGKIEGRSNEKEITVFDSTGLALLDIAAAKIALDLAEGKTLGSNVNL